MKKEHLLCIAFISIMGLSFAQKEAITGPWLVTKVETATQIENPYMITNFTEDGKMVMMGIDVGTWDYITKSNEIIMKSNFDKDFNGNAKVLKITNNELILEKDGAKLTYQKLDLEKIATDNTNSGLIGMWELKNNIDSDAKLYVTFIAPDEFKWIQKEENSETTVNGTWLFNKNDKTLIMIGFRNENLPAGENNIIKLNKEHFELENNGNTFIANKKAESRKNIERLTFSQEDFFTEDGNYKYEGDQEKLPWLNWSEMKMELLNVNQLVYNYSTLIKNSKVFENKTLTANVNATIEEEGFNIDYIFNGFDSYNLPEDYSLPLNTEYSNPLYPLYDMLYRIIGNEQITTPAGTFDCTVLEAYDDSEVRKKLWMIDNKIGVYAKIIEDNPDEHFGSYHVYELQSIHKNN